MSDKHAAAPSPSGAPEYTRADRIFRAVRSGQWGRAEIAIYLREYDAIARAEHSALTTMVAKVEALAARYASDASMYRKAAADAERMCVGAGDSLRAGFGCSRAIAKELRSLAEISALHAQALETGRVE